MDNYKAYTKYDREHQAEELRKKQVRLTKEIKDANTSIQKKMR